MKLNKTKVTENTNIWIPLIKPFIIRMFSNALFLFFAFLIICLASGYWKFTAAPFVALVMLDLSFYLMGVVRRKKEKDALLKTDGKN